MHAIRVGWSGSGAGEPFWLFENRMVAVSQKLNQEWAWLAVWNPMFAVYFIRKSVEHIHGGIGGATAVRRTTAHDQYIACIERE